MREYVVYVVTNKYHTVLYVGITNNIKRRAWEHRQGVGSFFASCYKVKKLVYYEIYENPELAIRREKQLKNLLRRKKIALIGAMNPEWNDLWKEIVK